MDYKFSKVQGDELINKLKEDYKIYAPISFDNEGRHSYTNNIRYGEINSFSDIVYKEKSQFSPKELLIPINHTLSLKFEGKEIDATDSDIDKDILIVLRSCDLHGIKRIDNSLKNDNFYRNRRDKVKFMVMGCPKSFDTCFCVSMRTNECSDYSLGIKFEEDNISIKVKDDSFNKYFKGSIETEFHMEFIKENEIKVIIPEIETWDKVVLDKVKELDLWNTYKNRCIGCGSCNMSCITCSCMLTQEVIHTDNSKLKEVKRTWNGCQLVKSSALKNKDINDIVPTRIRQRVLDKFYRPKLDVSREQICVGCGRCTDICPRYINFSTTVNKLSDELLKIYEDLGRKIK